MDTNTKYAGLIADLNKLNEQQLRINAEGKALKKELEEYITDKSIPVLERYAVWANAPETAKNTGDWVQHLDYAGEEISWFDDYPYTSERGAIIDLSDFIEYMEEQLAEHLANPERGWNEVCRRTPTREANDQFIEDVLAANLASFCNDW